MGGSIQNSFYIGINIENILYGIELVLYFKTVRILMTPGRNKGARKRSDLFYAIFSTIMLFCVTVWVATQAMFGQEMWILQANYPGGGDAYWNNNISVWYVDWGTTAIIVLQLMTDGLMIYRCRIIWNSHRVIIIPAILWFSTLVLGILVDWTSSSPGGNFFAGLSAELGLAYYTVSVFLNATLTCMICYYMLRHGRRIQAGLGREYASSYYAIITLIVESVVPYTLSGIAFLVSLGINSPGSVALSCVYMLMMCISPQMLILRVLMGRAWDKETCQSSSPTTLAFGPGATGLSRSQWFDGETSTVGPGPPMYSHPMSKAYHPAQRDCKIHISSA